MALALACSGGDDKPPVAPPVDAGPDTSDAAVSLMHACVTSPTAAPFASGACNSPQPSSADSLDEALGKLGLDRCKVQQDPAKMTQAVMNVFDKRQMKDFTPLLQWPLRLPGYGAETAKWLDDATLGKTPVASAIAAAAARRGAPVVDCPDPAIFDVQPGDPAPLESALADLASTFGTDFDPDATTAAVAPLPLDLQRALVPVVRAMSDASQAIAAAVAPSQPFAKEFAIAPSWVIGTESYTWSAAMLTAFDQVDVASITRASLFMAQAVESQDLARFKGTMLTANVELDTPLGPLVIHGAGKDDYEPGSKAEKAALFLDTGGDDTYRVPVAAATPTRPIALAIDLDGADTYAYVEKTVAGDGVGHRLTSDGSFRYGSVITSSRVQRQGSALLGVGISWDLGQGDDTYRSLAASQGMGIFGVGVLFDEGGSDHYSAETLSQGAAAWGIGLLLDAAGDDHYVIYNAGEGFGFTQGVGALVDESGTDDYYSDPGDPSVGGDAIYPNAQLPSTGNTSMTQGSGEGHRPDAPEPGFEFPGGIGILRDASGNDHYVTSVFGQASGFAMGIGLLLEGAGDDVYEGLWYVQGANAHTSVSLFSDGAGNDKHNPTFPIKATSIGVGHDFGCALHVDTGGDDAYIAPGLSLGSGNANGIGMMVITGGSDSFNAGSVNSLGAANSTEIFKTSRGSLQTLGVFVKAGGAGAYTVGGAPQPGYVGGQWSYAPNNTPDGGADGGMVYDFEKSIGIDRPSGTASLP